MDANAQSASTTREALIKKLDKLPTSLLEIVSRMLDGLLLAYIQEPEQIMETQSPASHGALEPINTLDELFEELDKLPEAAELANLTKRQRKDLITASLREKYRDTELDLSWRWHSVTLAS